jgi:hypothetical protein
MLLNYQNIKVFSVILHFMSSLIAFLLLASAKFLIAGIKIALYCKAETRLFNSASFGLVSLGLVSSGLA